MLVLIVVGMRVEYWEMILVELTEMLRAEKTEFLTADLMVMRTVVRRECL